ncbi:HIT family protein [Nocardioides dongkuii]|uniref:HIT family protein n=1 Tax=Nocardioides dongkuii TaxID=2760089 RepID=UPI001C7026EE|nr:hypothetical protein [Nocardioides dongkuii]
MSDPDAWKADRIGAARAGTNPTVLARMPQSYAVIGDTQFLPGYCVLLVDDPAVDRLTDLPKRQRLEFLDSMDTLGQAVETACRALDPGFRRMNYEILGNTDAYLHAHLFARYEWEPEDRRGQPVWRYDPQEFYGDESALAPRHDELRSRIVAELAGYGASVSTSEPDDSGRQIDAATQDAVDAVATSYARDSAIDVEDRLRGEMSSRGLEGDERWFAEVAEEIRTGRHVGVTDPEAPGSLGGDNGGA